MLLLCPCFDRGSRSQPQLEIVITKKAVTLLKVVMATRLRPHVQVRTRIVLPVKMPMAKMPRSRKIGAKSSGTVKAREKAVAAAAATVVVEMLRLAALETAAVKCSGCTEVSPVLSLTVGKGRGRSVYSSSFVHENKTLNTVSAVPLLVPIKRPSFF